MLQNLNQIKGITKDSSKVKKDFIYFAFCGNKVDGHNFIEEAFENGAKYVIGTKKLGIDNYFAVEDINAIFSFISKKVYQYDEDNLFNIGITGTDGKTSTALIIDKILREQETSLYIGTSGVQVNGTKVSSNPFTTPFPDELFKTIKEFENDVDNLVLEISSHALEQKRVNDLRLDIAIFTNLSSDHLDFHKTIENYFEAKSKITGLLKENGRVVTNIDDEFGAIIKKKIKGSIGFGQKESDYQISKIVTKIDHTCFTLKHEEKEYSITTSLLAEFNVYNLTAAIIALHLKGYELINIISSINNYVVPGRMEIINHDKRTFILDFAHTADSISKIMSFVNENKEDRKVVVIGGSAGDRDQTKRPSMGREMSRFADYLILTEDDPRHEKVRDINNQIKSGIEKKIEVIEIENRVEALKKGISLTNSGIIILLGKTGQEVQYYDGFTKEYNEKETLIKILKDNYGY